MGMFYRQLICDKYKLVVLTIGLLTAAHNVYAINPTLATIPDNTWVKVESGGLQAPVGILGYSGMAYDSKHGQLLVFGGGHDDYGGNEVWSFDTTTLKWTRMYEPDPESAYVLANYDPNEPGKLQASGRPLSRHTYDNIEFIDHAGVMVTFNGYTVDSAHGGGEIGMVYPMDTWAYDPMANKWTYKTNTPDAMLYGVGSAAYDADSHLLVAFEHGNVWVYDIDSDTWAQRKPAPDASTGGYPLSAIETVAEYDSKRGVVYLFAGEWDHNNQLWFYDDSSNKWTKVNPSGALPPAAGGYGLAYDRVNDVLIAFRGGVGTWVYDPTQNNWAEQQPTTGNPVHAAGRIHGNLKYDPENNVTWLVTYNSNYTIETWAYRYKKPIDDSTAPSGVSGVSTSGASATMVELNWSAASDAESGISGYVVYRDGTRVGTVTGTSYQDTGLSESSVYSYEVAAVNGAGLEGPRSGAVSGATLADLTAPTLVSVSASGDPTQVLVGFSEPVLAVSAEQASNYTINNGVAVNTAALEADGMTVRLTTSVLSEGVTYRLTVENVYDQAVAANVISPGSGRDFEYVAALGISGTQPSTYEWGKLAVGEGVYVDRDYTYSGVPTAYTGLDYLRTSNDDKFVSGAGSVSFEVNQPVVMYVGYDTRNMVLPSWLQGWTDTGDELTTTDGTLHLYAASYTAGTVSLGGNEMGNSMYVVLMKGATGTVEPLPPAPSPVPPSSGGDTGTSDGTTASASATSGGGGGSLGLVTLLSLLLFALFCRSRRYREL
jgi:hypothetical protein